MTSKDSEKNGLYWTPRGGNNADTIWASCHTFTSVITGKNSDNSEKDTIIIDIGQIESPQTFLGGTFDKIIPGLADCINIEDNKPVTKENEAKAVFLTHGHSDHIEGVFEYSRMGIKLPPVYASDYTIAQLTKGFVDRDIAQSEWPEMRPIKPGEKIEIGNMAVEVFAASHSIPGSLSFKISNPEASIFHSGDTKADETSFLDQAVDLKAYDKMAKEGGVDLMTFDATSTHLPGHATYEEEVFDAYSNLFEQHKGQQVITAISVAHTQRLATVIAAAEKAGKNIILHGGSEMKKNVMGLRAAGHDLQKKFPNIKIINASQVEAKTIDLKNCVTITTGIYAEKYSPFIQSLRGHNDTFRMDDNAVVIMPTSGDKNERWEKVFEASDKIKGKTVYTGKEIPLLYGSGHAQSEDFKKIAAHVRPKAVAPIHCSLKMADDFNNLAIKNGYKVLGRQIHNGETVRVTKNDMPQIVSHKQPTWYGVNHEKQADGSLKTRFSKAPDNGYSALKGETVFFADRQKEAQKKIAAYKDKQTRVQETALQKSAFVKRGKHGR